MNIFNATPERKRIYKALSHIDGCVVRRNGIMWAAADNNSDVPALTVHTENAVYAVRLCSCPRSAQVTFVNRCMWQEKNGLIKSTVQLMPLKISRLKLEAALPVVTVMLFSPAAKSFFTYIRDEIVPLVYGDPIDNEGTLLFDAASFVDFISSKLLPPQKQEIQIEKPIKLTADDVRLNLPKDSEHDDNPSE